MKKKRIKLIALLMSIFMILPYSEVFAAQHYTNPPSTTWSNTTYFKTGTTEDNAPTISLVYLEKGSDGTFTEVTPKTPDAVGATFYVGLKLSNFGQYKAMDNGVKNIDIPIVYNFSYIRLYAGSISNANEATMNRDSFATKVIQDTKAASADSYLNKTFDKEFYGEYIPTPLYDLSITAPAAPSEVKKYMGETVLSCLLLSITTNSNASDTDLTSNTIDTDYVMIAQAEVKKIPENGAALPVLSIAPSAILTTTLGSLGMTYGNDATPWHPYVILDDSGTNIFPASYTLEYYNSADDNGAVVGDKIHDETIKENNLKAAGTGTAEGNLTPPNTDDYFMGWKVADGDNDKTNDADFDGNDLSGILPADPATPIKVYANWQTGYPVNFYNEDTEIGDTTKIFATKYVKPDGNSVLGAANLPDPNPTKEGYGFDKWLCEDGSDFDADTKVIATSAGLNVYAKWTEKITINYDTNGSSDTIDSSTGAPSDPYALPEAPTRNNYTFVGWNTKKNGASDYISVTSGTTYQNISDLLDNTKTMYAQWAAVPPEGVDDVKGDTPTDPDTNGIRVKFNSNAGTDTSVVDAKPQTKYPSIGDAIGEGNMPDPPTRDKYKFNGWNTKASGGGDVVTETTQFTQAFIDGLDKEDDGKEVELYATWIVDPDYPDAQADMIKVNFIKNAADATAPKPGDREVVDGDTLNNLPEPPEQDGFLFMGWFKDSNASDGIDDTAVPDVKADTPITKDMANSDGVLNLYAAWYRPLKVEIEYRENNTTVTPVVYDGNEKTPEIVKIWTKTPDDGKDDYSYEITGSTFNDYKTKLEENWEFKINGTSYGKPPTNAGEYDIEFTVPDDMSEKGVDVATASPTTYTIEQMALNFKVQNQQAQYAGTGGAAPATITVTTTDIPADFNFTNDVKATYKQLDLPDGDNEITAGKFGFTQANPKATDFADSARIGKYVIELSLNNSNYKVGTVDADIYPEEAVENKPIYYPGSTAATAIKYEITPNDPKATSLVVTKEGVGKEKPEALTESDYKTPKTFTSDDEATTDATKKNHYWVTVDKDTEAVDIYVGAETYYTVKINNAEAALMDGTAKGTVGSLKKTIEVDENGVITKTDVENVIPVEVGGSGSDPKTYTIHVRRLADTQATDLKVTEENNADNKFDLKDNTFEKDKPFKPSENEYWVRVPNDKETVDVIVSALGQGDKKITINGTPATPDENGEATVNVGDLKPAIEKNPDGTLKKDDDNNVIINAPKDITVVIGEEPDAKTYTIHVQRLGEGGGINLKPGNSPYGMIERMRAKGWTRAQVNAVKDKLFDHSESVEGTDRYKFRTTLDVDGTTMNALPDGADTSIFYNPKAWGNEEYAYFGSTTEINTVFDISYDPKYNLDMDDSALFIYQHTPFVDPGITVYDEAGQPIDLTEEGVSVKVTAKDIVRLNGNMLYAVDSTNDVELELDENGRIENLTTTAIANLIRPDVYTLEYEITRTGKDPIVANRNLILLAKRCDADINDDLNGSDLTVIKNGYLKKQLQLLGTKTNEELNAAGVDVELKNLYVYRILDSDLNAAINGSDVTVTKNSYLKDGMTPGKIQLYPMFDREGEIVE